ncbi:MAG: hypothetical protein IT184_09880 [Acidobacteria bacterium]|nr:hypothetical protein [Acidobacteriota bacterium]
MTARSTLTLGVSGARHNAAIGVCAGTDPLAVCELERLNRIRGAGLPHGDLPADLVDTVLRAARGRRADVEACVVAEPEIELPASWPLVRVDHHRAHASAAFDLSPFEEAAVLICDRRAGSPTSVWTASRHDGIRAIDEARAVDFASCYVQAAGRFGLSPRQLNELEALARLDEGDDRSTLASLLQYADGELVAADAWVDTITSWLDARPGNPAHRARVAASFQRHLGDLLVALAGDVRQWTGRRRLCIGGGLFYNTYFTTRLRQCGLFDDVFTAPNPGNAGLSIGAVLAASDQPRPSTCARVSPFLGPQYSTEEIKATLDNCKLSYEYVGEQDVVDIAARALARGELVGWFQGRMEWAHRALGHRSILASPLSPYVLDNLNTFLKHRPRHRAYGVSAPIAETAAYFDGPPASPFMEYEYRPRDPERFRHVMPAGLTRVRVQTVDDEDPTGRFGRLHAAVGAITGVPVLVNTSFNGFLEPMVCSPRDAIRVFFGTGLDLVVLDRFVVRK